MFVGLETSSDLIYTALVRRYARGLDSQIHIETDTLIIIFRCPLSKRKRVNFIRLIVYVSNADSGR